MTQENPQYKPGDVVNGHVLIVRSDGQMVWIPLVGAPAVATSETEPPIEQSGPRGVPPEDEGAESIHPTSPSPDAAAVVENEGVADADEGPTDIYTIPGEAAPAAPATAVPSAAAAPATAAPTDIYAVQGVPTASAEVPPKRSRRALWITAGAVAGVLLIGTIANAATHSRRDSIAEPAVQVTAEAATATDPSATPTPKPTKTTVLVDVPADLVGMTAADAASALTALGLAPKYDGEAGAKVLAVSPSDARLEPGTKVTLTVEQPPAMSISQKNAVGKAKSYLAYTSFSRPGLIGQLEFEGFSTEDATFAVDKVAPDWNQQAAGKAKSYLEYTSFSRDGLYDQLIFEGFSDSEANAGLAAVGY